MSRDRSPATAELIDTVRLQIEEVPELLPRYASGRVWGSGGEPGDRAWLFLDYPGWELGRYRWMIVARARHEDFQLVALFGSTHSAALDLIPKEVELAKLAIERIRELSANTGAEGHKPDAPLRPAPDGRD